MPGIDRLLTQLDRKTQEVEIEARVVAATRSFARDIGTQLGFGWGNGHDRGRRRFERRRFADHRGRSDPGLHHGRVAAPAGSADSAVLEPAGHQPDQRSYLRQRQQQRAHRLPC